MPFQSCLRNSKSTSSSSLSSRLASKSQFVEKLRQMSLPLAPLVQMTTGQIHPYFPKTLLGFWLLTDDQLDALALFYHQRTHGCPWKYQYPCPITWSASLSTEEKRRKIGKFIGLRGCDTPIETSVAEREPQRQPQISWQQWAQGSEIEVEERGNVETVNGKMADADAENWEAFGNSDEQLEREARRNRMEDEAWKRKMRPY